MALRLIDLNLDTVLWDVMTRGDADELTSLPLLEPAELHRLARACDALAQRCYGLAAPRPDVLPAGPDGGAS